MAGNPKNIWKRITQSVSRKLQFKLLISFAGIGIFAVFLVSFYSFYLAKEALLFRTFEQLTAAREAKRQNIEEYIKNKLNGTKMATATIAMNRIMTDLKENPSLEVNDKAVNLFLKGENYHSILVIFDTANYAYGHFTDKIKFTNKVSPEMHDYVINIYNTLNTSKNSLVFDYLNFNDTFLLTMASPVFNENGTFRAVVALTLPLQHIDKIMLAKKAVEGSGMTGETYLVGKDGYMRSTSRFNPKSVMKVKVKTQAVEQALSGQKNTTITKDYRDSFVLSSFSPINVPGLDWVIVSEIDEHEILVPVRRLREQVLGVSGVVLLIFIIVVIWNSRQLSKPLVKLRSMAIEIARGDYGNTIPVTTHDEVGQLSKAFNSMSLQIYDQRKQLLEKNREILDSITYAKRIQTGLLPSQRLIENLLNESFVLYVPKNIVSGDFYYLGSELGQIIIAVGDCTGHGVPGAFVSGIGLGALQRTIKGFEKTKPSEILDTLNDIVSELFAASEMDIHDGMDISICSIDLQGKVLQYAGANNSMLFIRDGVVHVLKADRQPIGKQVDVKPFQNHELKIQEGDCIYMFSDGYADQFGGPKGKKFMISGMKQLLLEIHKKPMVTQKFLMEEALLNWKGKNEQIDDICIFGIRL